MPALISRTEALSKGLKRYFTGRPCLRGHVAERRVKGRICTTCGALQNAARRAADIERYRRETRERSRRAHQANPEIRRARDRAYYAADPQKYIKKTRRWQVANRDYFLAGRRKRQSKRYRDGRIRAALRGTQIAALRSKVPHNISYADLKRVWPEACPIFNVPFFTEDTGGQEGRTPQVVRIDEAQGFVQGNVIVLSKDAALLRRSVSAKDWAEWLSTLR